MKILFLFLICGLGLNTSCSKKKDGGGGSSPATQLDIQVEPTVDNNNLLFFTSPAELRELNDDRNQIHQMLGILDFGVKTNPDQILNPERIIKVRNKGDSNLFLKIDLRGQGEFILVEDDCGVELAAHASCDIKLQFSGGTRRNGKVKSSLWFKATETYGGNDVLENDKVIQLSGELDLLANEYLADSTDDGDTIINMIIDNPYDVGVSPIQKVQVINSGDDPLTDLSFLITSAYEIYIDDCPEVLEEGDTCDLYVFYKDFMTLEHEDPVFGYLRASSAMSDDYILSLTGGDVVSEEP